MFNSRNPLYRNPTGAVADGTSVHFKISLPRDLCCSCAYLVMEQERAQVSLLDMFWCGMNGNDEEWWECDFTPSTPGLYFYHFELKTGRGLLRISRFKAGQGMLGGNDRWQLTAYDKNSDAPDWMAGGVMYQIFPDRFRTSGRPKAEVPADRKLHTDWSDLPDWAPDQQGRITNSDYFGGDLEGIEKKLPYLQELGVTCLYLNPIFEAHSNHRYDTADYSKIDPLLGTEEDFCRLCKKAEAMGIRILLDGVFSHTGSDSVYFNREGRYTTPGAYNSQTSPYSNWYHFRQWPDSYDCWWNFTTLPNVNEVDPSYNSYINGEYGIIRKWLKLGASGWRLDVADELPDAFLDALHQAVREEKKDALVLGEVWEDASNKTAYGIRRRYLLGNQLDTVMNYPFRDAILNFLLVGKPERFVEAVDTILENYPPAAIRLLMNHIGTHDTERALTLLGGASVGGQDRKWQSEFALTSQQRTTALHRMRLAAVLQYMLPGVPCIYYGDEAGMEGCKDPFNRACYPWGREDQELIAWYKTLGKLRREHRELFAQGEFHIAYAKGNILILERTLTKDGVCEKILAAINRSSRPQSVKECGVDFSQATLLAGDLLGPVTILLPCSCSILRFETVLAPPVEPELPRQHTLALSLPMAAGQAPLPTQAALEELLRRRLPKETVGKYDFLPILGDFSLRKDIVAYLSHDLKADAVAAPEALGWILGAAVADTIHAQFHPIRKGGRLPYRDEQLQSVSYVDYSMTEKIFQMRKSPALQGKSFLLCDDWIGSGAQITALESLLVANGCKIVGILCIGCNETPAVHRLRQTYPFRCILSEPTDLLGSEDD